MTPRPPRFAEWLIERLAPDETSATSMLGDLHEEFSNRASRGEGRARVLYVGQALALSITCVRIRAETALRRVGRRNSPESSRSPELMDSLLQDLRFSLRVLRGRRTMSSVTILTIAAAIGTAAAMFTVVDSVLLRPLPFPASERVVRLGSAFHNASFFEVVPYLDVVDYRNDAKSFSAVSAFSTWQGTLALDNSAELVRGVSADDAFPQVLSLRVQLGRPFAPADFVIGGPAVALITDQLWTNRFGRDRAILGRTVTIDERPRTIVGILAPRAFNYPSPDLGMITPLRVTPGSGQTSRSCRCFNSIGLLAPGVSLERGRTELAAITTRIDRESGKARVVADLRVEALRDAVVGPSRDMLVLLSAMVLTALLVACVNVANLLLGQSAARSRELAVRAAIGGTVGRILRQLTTESMVLAAIGSAIGTALAPVLSSVLIRLYPGGLPRENEVGLSMRVLAVSFVLTLLAGALASAPSVRRLRRLDLAYGLRTGGAAGTSRERRRVAATLVVGQIALSVMLIFAAGLLLRTFQSISRVDPGFSANGLLTFRLDAPTARYPSATSVVRFLDRSRASIAALPGVRDAGYTSYLPFGGGLFLDDFVREEIGDLKADNPKAAVAMVSPGYERSMGATIMRGRGFASSDDSAAAPVAIINDVLARKVYAGVDPIGRTIRWAGQPHRTIVGVMSNMRSRSLWKEPDAELFIPASQEARWSYYVTVRVDRGAETIVPSIRNAVRAIDPTIAMSDVMTMEGRLAAARAPQRFRAMVIASLGLLALFLAILGIYGVMANTVAQRTREIGIRMAIGEAAEQVRWRVVLDAMKITGIGVGLGALLSLVTSRWLASFLIGVRPRDIVTLTVAVSLLGAAALVAVYLPARRASRVDPVTALRMD
jgi:predicted permease